MGNTKAPSSPRKNTVNGKKSQSQKTSYSNSAKKESDEVKTAIVNENDAPVPSDSVPIASSSTPIVLGMGTTDIPADTADGSTCKAAVLVPDNTADGSTCKAAVLVPDTAASADGARKNSAEEAEIGSSAAGTHFSSEQNSKDAKKSSADKKAAFGKSKSKSDANLGSARPSARKSNSGASTHKSTPKDRTKTAHLHGHRNAATAAAYYAKHTGAGAGSPTNKDKDRANARTFFFAFDDGGTFHAPTGSGAGGWKHHNKAAGQFCHGTKGAKAHNTGAAGKKKKTKKKKSKSQNFDDGDDQSWCTEDEIDEWQEVIAGVQKAFEVFSLPHMHKDPETGVKTKRNAHHR